MEVLSCSLIIRFPTSTLFL